MCEAAVPLYYNTSLEPANYTYYCNCQPRNSLALSFTSLSIAFVLILILCFLSQRCFFEKDSVGCIFGTAMGLILFGCIFMAIGYIPYNTASRSVDPYDGCSANAPLNNDDDAPTYYKRQKCNAIFCSYSSTAGFVGMVFGVFFAMIVPCWCGKCDQ